MDENGNEKVSKTYAGRSVGDCPEVMYQDNSLFWDLLYSYDLHMILTCMLPCTDPHRFSKATPIFIGSTIVCLWDPDKGVGVAGSCRIVQYILWLKEIFLLYKKMVELY